MTTKNAKITFVSNDAQNDEIVAFVAFVKNSTKKYVTRAMTNDNREIDVVSFNFASNERRVYVDVTNMCAIDKNVILCARDEFKKLRARSRDAKNAFIIQQMIDDKKRA